MIQRQLMDECPLVDKVEDSPGDKRSQHLGSPVGKHLAPGMSATGRHPWGKVLPYWGAQVLGAFVAGGILYFVYQGALVHQLALNHLTIGDIAQGPTFGGSGLGFVFTPAIGRL